MAIIQAIGGGLISNAGTRLANALAALVGPKGEILLPELRPEAIPPSVRDVLAAELRDADGSLDVDTEVHVDEWDRWDVDDVGRPRIEQAILDVRAIGADGARVFFDKSNFFLWLESTKSIGKFDFSLSDIYLRCEKGKNCGPQPPWQN